jgi:hypothetical protein
MTGFVIHSIAIKCHFKLTIIDFILFDDYYIKWMENGYKILVEKDEENIWYAYA